MLLQTNYSIGLFYKTKYFQVITHRPNMQISNILQSVWTAMILDINNHQTLKLSYWTNETFCLSCLKYKCLLFKEISGVRLFPPPKKKFLPPRVIRLNPKLSTFLQWGYFTNNRTQANPKFPLANQTFLWQIKLWLHQNSLLIAIRYCIHNLIALIQSSTQTGGTFSLV